MKTEDHKMLGRYLADRWLQGAAPADRAAFLFGCVWPDYHYLSYVRGSFSKRFLHGHHFENAKQHVDRMVRKMRKRLWFRVRLRASDYFRLGVLVHYLADMFTYAHHAWFDGTLRMHSAYEMKLHQCFQQAGERIQNLLTDELQRRYGPVNWRQLHALYEREAPSPWNDLAYIVLITGSVVRQYGRAEQLLAKTR